MMDDLLYSSSFGSAALGLGHHHNPFIMKDVELTTGLLMNECGGGNGGGGGGSSGSASSIMDDFFGENNNDDAAGDNDDDFALFSNKEVFPEIPSNLFEGDLMDDLSSSSSSDHPHPHPSSSADLCLMMTSQEEEATPTFVEDLVLLSNSSASNSPTYSSSSSSVDSPPPQTHLVYSIVSDCDSLLSPPTPSPPPQNENDVKPLIIQQQQQQRRISRGRVNSLTPVTAETAELAALKRHIRMIRNRESASLSRKKKKEYVTNLEDRVKTLEQIVAGLKHENNSLRQKLCEITKKVPSSVSVVTATKAVALFSLCFFCAVVTNQSGGSGGYKNDNIARNLSSSSSSRVMVAKVTSSSQNRSRAVESVAVVDFMKQFKGNSTSTTASSTRCSESGESNFFNLTESKKVQSRLEGLFGGRVVAKKKNKPRQQQHAPLVYSLIAPHHQPTINKVDDTTKGLTVYGSPSSAGIGGGGLLGEYASILQKLERREDTFYVVSLTADNHLLLSAKSANETSRPKMTLLMPWRNETGGGREELMQIDCEVFQVFNLNKQPTAAQQQQKKDSHHDNSNNAAAGRAASRNSSRQNRSSVGGRRSSSSSRANNSSSSRR